MLKAIPSLPGYLVDELGNVYSTKPIRRNGAAPAAPRLMSTAPSHNRYLFVSVRLPNGKARNPFVHRLVLEAFVGPCPPGMQCRHLNGVRHDNRLVNLEWATPATNNADKIAHGTHQVGERAPRAKFSNLVAGLIRYLGCVHDVTGAELSEWFGLNEASAMLIVKGISYHHAARFQRGTQTGSRMPRPQRRCVGNYVSKICVGDRVVVQMLAADRIASLDAIGAAFGLSGNRVRAIREDGPFRKRGKA
jgi:hypothetical protein